MLDYFSSKSYFKKHTEFPDFFALNDKELAELSTLALTTAWTSNKCPCISEATRYGQFGKFCDVLSKCTSLQHLCLYHQSIGNLSRENLIALIENIKKLPITILCLPCNFQIGLDRLDRNASDAHIRETIFPKFFLVATLLRDSNLEEIDLSMNHLELWTDNQLEKLFNQLLEIPSLLHINGLDRQGKSISRYVDKVDLSSAQKKILRNRYLAQVAGRDWASFLLKNILLLPELEKIVDGYLPPLPPSLYASQEDITAQIERMVAELSLSATPSGSSSSSSNASYSPMPYVPPITFSFEVSAVQGKRKECKNKKEDLRPLHPDPLSGNRK